MNRWEIPETERKELVKLLKNFFNKFKNISNDEFEKLKNDVEDGYEEYTEVKYRKKENNWWD